MKLALKIIVGLAIALVALGVWARHSRNERIESRCYGTLYDEYKFSALGVGPATIRNVVEYDRSAFALDWEWISGTAEGGKHEKKSAHCITWGEPGHFESWDAVVWLEGDGHKAPNVHTSPYKKNR